MLRSIAVVGVDLGGTWVRLEGLDAKSHSVWSLKKPAPTVAGLPTFLKRQLKSRYDSLPLLAVGSRGVWSPAERRALRRKLKSLAEQVIVMSDVEGAWHAAFKKEGILVISGTGSIAYARDTDGCTGRAGGLGPQIGDEGSGYWIGKEWLRRAVAPAKAGAQSRWIPASAGMTTREIAALSRTVFQRALRGDRLAKMIVMEAQEHLADLVINLSERLHWKQRIPVSWSGTILDNAKFRKGFIAAVRRKTGRRCEFIKRAMEPAAALASLRFTAGVKSKNEA